MEFKEDKFEHMSFGNISEFPLVQYKKPSEDEIQNKNTVKNLGDIMFKNLDFKEHINNFQQTALSPWVCC